MLAAITMWTPLGAAQTLHCTSLQRVCVHTHTHTHFSWLSIFLLPGRSLLNLI